MSSGAVGSATPGASVPRITKPDDAPILIGKDVLELLTGAMYVDPLTIFREYVQNAADAIDEATLRGLYRPRVSPAIEISLDAVERSIRIRDTGAGIPERDFWIRMTSLGGSKKRGTQQRGFRGVGRLAGLGYATEIVFRSRAPGESKVSEIAWDARRLRELLRDAGYKGGLADVVRSVATRRSASAEHAPPHFFEVELRGVTRIRNDVLLNPELVRAYLGQVAPVPFPENFKFAEPIHTFLSNHGIHPGIKILLLGDHEPVVRPLVNRIPMRARRSDTLKDIEFFEIPSLDGSRNDAVGWVAHHSYLGAMPRGIGFHGLRVRVGNIQVGGHNTFESLFSEPRFNSWCIGEIHVVSEKIIPNGRRDDFEVNGHYQNLIGHAAALATRLSRLCRDRSIQRNRLRAAHHLRSVADERLIVLRDRSAPTMIKAHYKSLVTKSVAKLRRMSVDKRFMQGDQDAIARLADGLQQQLATLPALRVKDATLSFLPKNRRAVFLETLNMVIAACETPEQAAQITRRVFDKAHRRYR